MKTSQSRVHKKKSECIQDANSPESKEGGAKQEVITFKVSNELAHAMRGVTNRSEFIRAAILLALDQTCPLCLGTGVLGLKQKKHWDRFMETHSLRECKDCHSVYPQCSHS